MTAGDPQVSDGATGALRSATAALSAGGQTYWVSIGSGLIRVEHYLCPRVPGNVGNSKRLH